MPFFCWSGLRTVIHVIIIFEISQAYSSNALIRVALILDGLPCGLLKRKLIGLNFALSFPIFSKLGNFSSNLSCNFVAPLRHKLHGSLPSVTRPKMNMSCNVFVAVTVVRGGTNFYFVRHLWPKKKMRDMFISGHVTLGKHPCNLCGNRIAKQVAKKKNSLALLNYQNILRLIKKEEVAVGCFPKPLW